ncbi:TusE/DsrC/DsvC family sulfur relay protein [bacterium]|nr:TusE/DsrC/DsvC family sulfur relay protein [bacterium]
MPLFEAEDIKVEMDDKGYLVDGQEWSPALAQALAEADGLGGLTADHWKIIDFLRKFHGAQGAAPMIRVLCRETGFSLQRIYDLFPDGPARGACRIAGLPRPDSCV